MSPLLHPRLLTFQVLLISLIPLSLSAHMVGQSLEQKSGEYLIDVGYDTIDILEGQEVVFNATLIKNAGTVQWEYAPFDTIWFQMQQGEEQPFRKVLKLKAPIPANVHYTFAHPGHYQLSIAYLTDDQVIAQATFPLTVKSRAGQAASTKSVALVLFALLLFVVVSVVWHRRHKERYAYATQPVHAPARTKKTIKRKKRKVTH